jgi:hypothetical protein
MVTTASRVSAPEALQPPVEQPFPWIKVWAVFGAFYGGLAIYLYSRWLLSSPEPTPTGPSPLPDYMALSINIQIVLGWIAAPLMIYFFLIRPWRREGHLTLDGMMVIASVLVIWQDTYYNALAPYAIYNAHMPNWGSWNNFIPFIGTPAWTYPHGERVLEPMIWTGPVYIYAFYGFAVFLSVMMRKAKERWPQLTKAKLILVCLGLAWIGDIVLESLWIRTGVYAFVAVPTPKWATLFDGHYYQIPIYEPLMMGTLWCGIACLRYFRNDKGQTFLDRGVDRLKVSSRAKSGIRLLAVVGYFNLVILFCYSIPGQALSLHLRPWSEDIVQNRSYFTNGLCGPGTDYQCPGTEVPIPHGRSAHIDSEGRLAPAGKP